MKPYYEHAGITIYLGDCRDILPELELVDLVLTDPPYGLNYNNGDLANYWESAFGGDASRQVPRPIIGDNEEEANQLFQDFLNAVKPIMKHGSCCCCCCCGGGPKPLFARWTLWMDEIIGFKQAVVWDKGGLGMGIHFRRSYEFLLIAQKGSPAHRWNGGTTTSNVWSVPKIIPSRLEHPTAKPVLLMKYPIQLFSIPGDIVLDPFMGSGTTLVAAKVLGRKAIGIEINEDYCRIAVERLSQSVMDLNI
ncbi:MAG: Modification methylase DpnIIB [Firmicutes bacterium]|nr:Modification methylase DpnIIB [Bacillota bacterium]